MEAPLGVFFLDQGLACGLDWPSLDAHHAEIRCIVLVFHRWSCPSRCAAHAMQLALCTPDLQLHLLLLFQPVRHVSGGRGGIGAHGSIRVEGVAIPHHFVLAARVRLPDPLWCHLQRTLADRAA